MKRLYLLRHAKAANANIIMKDIDRALADDGLQDAAALGQFMIKKNYIPEMTLCSGAFRTRQTLETLCLPVHLIEYHDTLYDAEASDLLNAIQACDDNIKSLLVIGHNPAIHELALRLCSEESPASFLHRLMYGYAPGTLSVFDVPCACWNDIQMSQNKLVDLQAPIDYNAPERPTRWM